MKKLFNGVTVIFLIMVVFIIAITLFYPSFRNKKSFEDSINFKGLKITFSNDIEWIVINNRLGKHHGADAFKVPMTITNISNEPNNLNFYDYTLFGSKGTELDSVNFAIDGVIVPTSTPKALSGVTVKAHMNFLYDGDGVYTVRFKQLRGSEPSVQVQLPIKKGN